MLVLKCNIQITGAKIIKFDYVSQVEVATSMKTITDTAKLTVPRNLKFHDSNLLDYIKRGDKITIDLGYEDSDLQTVFKGYITNVSTGRPITIECEDEAWMLKPTTDLCVPNTPSFTALHFLLPTSSGTTTIRPTDGVAVAPPYR